MYFCLKTEKFKELNHISEILQTFNNYKLFVPIVKKEMWSEMEPLGTASVKI